MASPTGPGAAPVPHYGDRHVFNLLLTLSSTFTLLYIVGVSMPTWYVLQERVSNLSSCQAADRFLDPDFRRSVSNDKVTLSISSSLWYLKIRVDDEAGSVQKTVPFISLQTPRMLEGVSNGLIMQRVLPTSLTSVFMFLFVSLAVAFVLSASWRPSRRVYYGLATVFLNAGITTWTILSSSTSEHFVFSAASAFCVQGGEIKTNVTLLMLTGSCAIVGFLLGCILIHMATALRSNPSTCNTELCDVSCENAGNGCHSNLWDTSSAVVKTLDCSINKYYKM